MKITLVVESGGLVPLELTRDQLDRLLDRIDRPGISIDLTVHVSEAELEAIRAELGQ